MDEQIKGFLDMESVPGEDAIKIAKMAATNLEQYINLSDKAVAGSERTDSNF